ncbi:MAG: phage major capsid protein [Candidatus Dormibacteraeota bacterium]|nr:phage major capsid protein [Candidatus Dormibacteraeota bacterium]
MQRDERQARVAELERWVQEQHDEYEDDAFPEEVARSWEDNNRELDEHRRVLAELDARDARVARLASEGNGHRESGDGTLGAAPARYQGQQMVSRMNEYEVYDLQSVRFNPMEGSGGRGGRELRDRALRAVEYAHFSHPDAERAKVQGYVSHLLDARDSEDRYIARRILLTGAPAYRTAFAKTVGSAMRGLGAVQLSIEEQKAMESVRAMSVGTGSTGGFAVPYFLDPTVIPTSNLSVNPYRQICRVDTIPGNEWRGVTSAGVTASYAVEATEAADNSPTLAQPNLLMQRAQCFVPVSIELTQDWGALQGELAQLIQDAKDDLEALKFTLGSGTNEPTGLITGATTTTATATVATFAVGDLYLLEQSVPPRFRPRAQLIANRGIWNKVRQFDTAGGAGLWVYLPAGLDNNVPRGGNLGVQVLGYGANEASSMVLTTTTGSKIMVMGDPRYYIIVDRVGLDIEVIPHLFGAVNRFPTGQRGFFAYWRNNARVLDPNAFRVLSVA